MKSVARRHAGRPAPIAGTIALAAVALILAQPAAAQDETSNPNVIIDHSVLDDLTDGATGGVGFHGVGVGLRGPGFL
jgi:hypothetical protein